MGIADFKNWKRESLIDWLQTNDSNGIYTDELSKGEGLPPLTKIGALNIINRQLFDNESENLDLFEHYDLLPQLAQEVVKYSQMENTYKNCDKMLEIMQGFGFTFEYGLDAEPHNLREMTEEEKRDFQDDFMTAEENTSTIYTIINSK